MAHPNRRQFLVGSGAAGTVGLAGCLGELPLIDLGDDGDSSASEDPEALRRRILELEAELERRREREAELEDEVASLEDELEAVKTDLEESRERHDELEARVTALEDALDGLREVVVDQGFEDTPVGTYPSEWTNSGNSDAQVVDSTVASGTRAFRMKGAAGGCNESINRRPAKIPLGERALIRVSVYPTDDGGGCHAKNGAMGLNGGAGLYEGCGSARRLLRFNPDGRLTYGDPRGGTFDDLGTFTHDRWQVVEIEYEPTEAGASLAYTVNGEVRGELEKPATDCELADEINFLALTSGDYTVYWDALSVELLP